jgi:uncharacterized membrane protein YdjX (TVP38/TMEM64 family)
MMFIPVATKNYMMPLMEISFIQYAIPAVIFYIPYLGAMVLVGANLDNIVKVAESGGWSEMNSQEKFQYCFTMILATLTVLILFFFIWITWKKVKEITKAEQEADLLAQEEENLNKGKNGQNSDAQETGDKTA